MRREIDPGRMEDDAAADGAVGRNGELLRGLGTAGHDEVRIEIGIGPGADDGDLAGETVDRGHDVLACDLATAGKGDILRDDFESGRSGVGTARCVERVREQSKQKETPQPATLLHRAPFDTCDV